MSYIHVIGGPHLGALAPALSLREPIVRRYGSIAQFVEEYEPQQSGCVILRARDEQDVLDALQGPGLARRCQPSPLIVIAESLQARTVVKLWRAAVFDYLAAPFREHELLSCIDAAVEEGRRRRRHAARRDQALHRLARLTPREREVMRLMVAGRPSKAIAAEQGISVRTVEIHRRRVMHKTQCDSLPALVLLAIRSGELDPFDDRMDHTRPMGVDLRRAA